MYGICNPKTGDRLTGDCEIHFLEIPKFINKPVKEMTKMERWMAYFSGKLDAKGKGELAMSDAAIGGAYDATLTFFQMPEDRLKYLNRQMAIMDYQSGIESAEERGEKRGEDRTVQFFARLHDVGRDEEVFQVMNDAALRERLFREFHL